MKRFSTAIVLEDQSLAGKYARTEARCSGIKKA